MVVDFGGRGQGQGQGQGQVLGVFVLGFPPTHPNANGWLQSAELPSSTHPLTPPPPVQTMAGAGLVTCNLAEFIDTHCLQRWFQATTGPRPPFTSAELAAALGGLRASTAFPPILVSDWEARGMVFFAPAMANAIGYAINQALAAGV